MFSKAGRYQITETTTYETSNDQKMMPITFLDASANTSNTNCDGKWYSILPESSSWHEALYVDEPNDLRKIGVLNDGEPPVVEEDEIESFVVGNPAFEVHTLYPGQSITSSTEIYPNYVQEEEFHVGERYRYQFNGKALRWWDWGTIEVRSTST